MRSEPLIGQILDGQLSSLLLCVLYIYSDYQLVLYQYRITMYLADSQMGIL